MQHVEISQTELLLKVTSAIARELIQAHEDSKNVHLNEIRGRLSKQFSYGGVPRLVDIISAIPDEYKKSLLPNLRARPIRTASGVSLTMCTMIENTLNYMLQIAVVAVMCKPHRCPHIAMTGNICVLVSSSGFARSTI